MKIVVVGPTSLLADSFIKMANSAGHQIIQLGRNENTAVGKPVFYKADLTDAITFSKIVAKMFSEQGSVDVVINFIGTHHKPMDFETDDLNENLETFRHVMDVNVNHAFLITMGFAKEMIKHKHGHIIHLCSNASRLSLYGSYGYNASKHALEGLIKTAAAQLAHYNLRVNGIAPGTAISDLNRAMLIKDGKLTNRALSILAHTPTKKFCNVDGVSETILAACQPQRHLTGNVIFCDDGYNIEGHSWPDGNERLYNLKKELD
jgi:glucose 1-dehydrogenase